MTDPHSSDCQICQYRNPLGTRFCGSCGNLLAGPARGTVLRRPGFFERAGEIRLLGRPIGPSGVAAVAALALVAVTSLTLWMSLLYRDGRFASRSAPPAAIAEAAKTPTPLPHRPRTGPPAPSPPPAKAPVKKAEPEIRMAESRPPVLPVPRPISPSPAPDVPPSTDRPREYPPEQPAPTPPPSNPTPPPVKATHPRETLTPSPSLDFQPPMPSGTDNHPVAPLPPPAVGPTLQPPPRPAPESPRIPLSPKQGDLIWSGPLEKGMELSIDGLQPSAGSLRGDPLPGVPVMLTVQPPDIIVSRPPLRDDAYKRFVLRSPARRNTVVRIHWQILQ